jgi:hypothetical protein
MFDNGLERLNGFRVCELEALTLDLDTIAERGHQIVSCNDQHGRGHQVSLA